MGGAMHRCEAVVLRHTNYGEADRIVSLLTAEQGRQKAFARGARNSRKRFGSSLEPFSQVTVHYTTGRGALWSLRDTELRTSRAALRSDLERLALASYAVELTELLTEEGESHPPIYQLLCSYLDYLDAGGAGRVARLLLELRLVYLLGYIPHFLHCSDCLKVFGQEPVRFDAARGGSLCLACAGHAGFGVGLGTLGSLARTLQVAPDRFAGFHFGAQTLDEGGAILAAVLAQILPRQPKSLKFLK